VQKRIKDKNQRRSQWEESREIFGKNGEGSQWEEDKIVG
jgi:hypothetical protein